MERFISLFLSTVTGEFAKEPHESGLGDVRGHLRAKLNRRGVKIQVQEDFLGGPGTLLKKLDAYIKTCQAVVHLIGERTGASPKVPEVEQLKLAYADLAEKLPQITEHLADPANRPLSYTQWEYWLAKYHGIDCYIYALPTFGAPPPTDVLATEPDGLQRQRTHYAKIRAGGDDRSAIPIDAATGRPHVWELSNAVQNALADNLPGGSVFRPCHLPIAPLGELFVGRESFLEDLRRRQREKGARSWHLLHGLGGIGKTRLAYEFAHHYRPDFTAVLAIGADTPAKLETELAGLAGALAITLPADAKNNERVAAVRRWLAEHPGWLLVIDNVDTEEARREVAKVLPLLGDGHVLLTGRFKAWQGVESLEVHVLDRPDAVRYLLERTAAARAVTPDDEAEAGRLAADLGDLCLALTQAAEYIVQRSKAAPLTFAEYRHRFEANEKKARTWADATGMVYREAEGGVPLSVATTWLTTFDALTPAARAMLELFSFLAPDPLPRRLIEGSSVDKNLAAMSGHVEADAEEAAVELRDYSFLMPVAGDEGATLGQIHRLVQLVTRERLEPGQRSMCLTTIRDLFLDRNINTRDGRIGIYDSRDPLLWPRLGSHLRAVFPQFPNDFSTAKLIIWFAFYDERFSENESLYWRALRLHEQTLGLAHPETLAVQRIMARQLISCRKMWRIEPLYRRVLAACEQTYGPDHPSTLGSLNNLADLLNDSGRSFQAELLYERVIWRIMHLSEKVEQIHSLLKASEKNYRRCLRSRYLTDIEIETRLREVGYFPLLPPAEPAGAATLDEGGDPRP